MAHRVDLPDYLLKMAVSIVISTTVVDNPERVTLLCLLVWGKEILEILFALIYSLTDKVRGR
jgi:hypothetical protein